MTQSIAEPIPYTALRASGPLPLDGSLTSPQWAAEARSPGFVDMATGKPAILETQAALLWDDTHLHVGFWVQEPFPEAQLTERDSIIFRENDVEIFVDGGDCYYEFEMNARGAVYEVLFVWRDAFRRDPRFAAAGLDPLGPGAYSFGGDYDRKPESFWEGTHPRGTRWAFRDWDLPGLQAATHIDGALNDRTVRSKGWTAHVALPWAGMELLAGGRPVPPNEGDIWRLFLGRFQLLDVADKQVQAAWCWTPHGVYDTHMPHRFTPVRFGGEVVGR